MEIEKVVNNLLDELLEQDFYCPAKPFEVFGGNTKKEETKETVLKIVELLDGLPYGVAVTAINIVPTIYATYAGNNLLIMPLDELNWRQKAAVLRTIPSAYKDNAGKLLLATRITTKTERK